MKSKRYGLGLIAKTTGISIASVFSMSAAAQGDVDVTANLEEILVSARRTVESAQDVPISMTIYSQEALDRRNITSGNDLATFTPSLSANARFGSDQASFALRGFTQELRTTASVGIYFAEVVAPRGSGAITSGDGAGPGNFFDLQNVLVLKGPQGTLFGRNTTGGAIMLTPQEPTSELEGYIEVQGGNYDMQRLQGVINVPVSDTVRARFGVDTQQRDGWLINQSGVGPKELADVDYIAARASLIVEFSDALENYTILSYTDSENNGVVNQSFACNPESDLGSFCAGQQARQGDDFYSVMSLMDDPKSSIEQWQLINTTSWFVNDDFTIRNILSYSDLEQVTKSAVYGTDWMAGPYRFRFTGSVPEEGEASNAQSSLVEEIQFSGYAFDSSLKWQAGLYYENNKPEGDSSSQSATLLSCDRETSAAIDDINCVDVLRVFAFFSWDPLGGEAPPGPVGSIGQQQAQVEFTSRAIYGEATYDLSESAKLTLGLRYTEDKTESTSQSILYNGYPGIPLISPPAASPLPNPGAYANVNCVLTTSLLADNCLNSLDQDSDAVTGLINFDYFLTHDVMAYAKYTRGYRQGSVNVFGAEGVREFDQEQVDAYEIGAKSSFAGAVPGTFNISIFYNELTDQQIQSGFQSSAGLAPPTIGIVNAGESTIAGVEIETRLALTQNVVFDLSYTWLDTELKELNIPPSDPGAIYDIRTPAASPGGNLALSPENSIAATLSYNVPLAAEIGNVSAGITYVYTDEQLTTAVQPYGTLPSYELFNFNVSWEGIFGSNFDTSAFITNAFEEKYWVYVPGNWDSLGGEFRNLGEPRMFGVRLRYTFD